MPGEDRAATDWERLRASMVRRQIEARGVHDPALLDALRRVPRHLFLPAERRDLAYEDTPVPIGYGQTISQPYMVALMTEALCLRGGETVLEVGTGSGYQAALLAELGCTVHTVEREPALAGRAEALLARLGYRSVRVHCGDGSLGLADQAPFQRILVTAGGPRVPASLQAQLDPDGGVLVMPVGGRGMQELVRVTRRGERFREEQLGGCRFVPLVGAEGW